MTKNNNTDTSQKLTTGEVDTSTTPAIDPGIQETIEKYNKLESKLEESKKDFITILGIFASFFIFVSAEFQILRTVTDIWLLLGLSSFLLSGILLFAMVLTNIVRDKFQWKDFFNPVLILILILFLVTVLFFERYAGINIFYIKLELKTDKLSSALSLLTSIIILVASFFQWWNITYNGQMMIKKWVKYFFAICILLLIISLILLLLR
ncbi:MAG: hypothetical protein HYW33_03820 [Candidatus Blackburnbacteria bacterium]|nr:hypothetical protein [Candidatus Blackburnbacteria bacterium]